MKATYLTAACALALSFGTAACTAIPSVPTPAATPAPQAEAQRPPPAVQTTPSQPPVLPAPPPVAEPQFANYLDAPQTPGTWTYLSEPGETLAMFGVTMTQPQFIMRCAQGTVFLARATDTPARQSRAMTIQTETYKGNLQADPISGRDLVAAPLPPGDSLLDAMAITKGRIAVSVEGERTLYVPAWVEISRVIEDCR